MIQNNDGNYDDDDDDKNGIHEYRHDNNAYVSDGRKNNIQR